MKNYFVIFLLGLVLISGPINAAMMLTIDGVVDSFDENTVVIHHQNSMVRVPRKLVQAKQIRPGQKVSAVIQDPSTKIEAWAAKPNVTGRK